MFLGDIMVEVIKLNHQGKGIAYNDGKIIFIENAIDKEIIEPKIVKISKRYDEAIVNKYIKKSNERVNPICPYYTECGGCNIMHMNYMKQLQFKQEKIKNMVYEELNPNIKINEIVKSDSQVNYRNKATFQVNNSLGFFKDKSNNLIEVKKCFICNKLINDSIKYLEKLDLSKISKIICRTNNKELMIIIETEYKDLNIEMIKDIADSIYLKLKDNYTLKYGKKHIVEKIGNFNYLISPDSFFQINLDITKKLYDKINSLVGKNKNIIDLYCGTGSIGIYVSKNNNVTGIEINKYSYKDAILNKELNNISNINFICGDSGKSLKNIKQNIDTIIIDPPRNGLNKETLNNILKFNPKNIIYVSCEPITLIRDLKILSENYNILEITPYDMFPNTYHMETISYLERLSK